LLLPAGPWIPDILTSSEFRNDDMASKM